LIKVLFVCYSNICRSPAAEAIMNNALEKAGLSDQVSCDSAGTHAGHSGRAADPRMTLAAKARGYTIQHTAKQVTLFDLIEYEYVIAMDRHNYLDLRQLAVDDEQRKKIYALCEFCSGRHIADVPDPYSSGQQGFETVLDILEEGCWGLMKKLRMNLMYSQHS